MLRYSVTVFVLSLLIPFPSAYAASYTMVIPHLLPEDLTNNEVHPALVHFESLVEAATGGDIDVQIFAGGQLGSEVETGKEAQAGKTVQSAVMSSGALSSFFREYQIVTTPFLFPDYRLCHFNRTYTFCSD